MGGFLTEKVRKGLGKGLEFTFQYGWISNFVVFSHVTVVLHDLHSSMGGFLTITDCYRSQPVVNIYIPVWVDF